MTHVIISHGLVSVDIPISPDSQDIGKALVDGFAKSLCATSEPPLSAIELLARFIEFVSRDHSGTVVSASAHIEFERRFCNAGKTNVHAAVAQHGLSEDQACAVLRGYYSAWPQHTGTPMASTLFSDPTSESLTATIMMVFEGSIGFDNAGSVCLAELQRLVDVYRPLVLDFICQMSVFLYDESRDLQIAHCYPHGLAVAQWVSASRAQSADVSGRKDVAPAAVYINSAPVAAPLVGLVQLVRLVVLYKTLNIPVEQVVKSLSAVAGHSHGIVVAVAVSMATNEAQLLAASQKALGTLMLAGCLPQMVCPQPYNEPLAATGNNSIGVQEQPSAILSVEGATRYIAEAVINKYNKFHRANSEAQVYMSMINTDTWFLVSGNKHWLAQFQKIVREKAATDADGDQDNVPFILRKPCVVLKRLLAVGAFHSAHMAPVVDRHLDYAQSKGWLFAATDMITSVRAPDGSCADIRSKSSNLTRVIAEYLYTRPAEWPVALSCPGVTHIVDMTSGSSETALVRRATFQIIQGRGISLVCADRVAAIDNNIGTALQSCAGFYMAAADNLAATAENWKSRYAARLLHSGAPDTTKIQLHIDTKLHRLLGGMPMVMVGGMHPTTASVDFVAAVAHAGYLAELDISHIRSERELTKRTAELCSKQPHGHWIALSGASWSDSRKWEWQLSTTKLMRQRGLPIIGLGIEDGAIPDLASAGFIDELQAAGLQYLALRPLTRRQLLAAVEIAGAYPSVFIMLQWMGGRSGGRHSYEEFHTPIMSCYAAIRAHPNIVLVAGAGFGDVNDAAPYISGAWAVGCSGGSSSQATMSFDGIMLRSRVMASEESPVDPEIKQLITQMPGISAYDIELLHTADLSAGVISVLDDKGLPVHVLATRAALLCRDLSDTVFGQPREKHLALLQARKQEIVERLNADYMRPWFGKKSPNDTTAGSAVVELQDMTYAEVLDRLVELVYVKQQKRWADPSLHALVAKFAFRTAMRLRASEVELSEPVALSADYELVLDEIASYKQEYPRIFTQLLASEDVHYFVSLCTHAEQTVPVPFVPVMDERFAWYMMRDCLAQCGEMDAVLGCDVQRVLVPHSPVAVAYTKTANQPVGEILNGIYEATVEQLLRDQNQNELVFNTGRAATGPAADYKGIAVLSEAADDGTTVRLVRLLAESMDSDSNGDSADQAAWADALTGGSACWLSALLAAPSIVQGAKLTANYAARLLQARVGRQARVVVCAGSGIPVSLELSGSNTDNPVELSASYSIAERTVDVGIFHGGRRLDLAFRFSPATPWAPIHEAMAQRTRSTRRLFSDESSGENSRFEITAASVGAFCRANGIDLAAYPPNSDGAMHVPLDYLSAVIAQRSAFAALASNDAASHSLLVAELSSTATRLIPGGVPPVHAHLRIGDSVECRARVIEVSQQPGANAMTAVVFVSVLRQDICVAEVTFSYAFPGIELTRPGFRHTSEPEQTVLLASADDVAILESKPWFAYADNGSGNGSGNGNDSAFCLLPGARLVFRLHSQYTLRADGSYDSVRTDGTVCLRKGVYTRELIGRVEYVESMSRGNPVLAYLQRLRESMQPDYTSPLAYIDAPHVCPLPGGTYSLTREPLEVRAPDARFSSLGDACVFSSLGDAGFSNFAGLGLSTWCSAAARALIEKTAGGGCPQRTTAFSARVLGTVKPGERLLVHLEHVAMSNGALVISGRVHRLADPAARVLECTATVDAPRTAFAFTGQGSQEPGMGMALYARSPVARAVLDRADRHMRARFGFSLLSIMRDNPRDVTVHFGGASGARIRRNYMEFKRRSNNDKHKAEVVPLFPEVTPAAPSLTFHAAAGLLHATQFAQPAIMAFDIAAMADMRAHGLVPPSACVAGHSLGEYGALSAFGLISLEDIIDITFIRGMTMQATVNRDASHMSDFAMVAVNPARVASTFTDAGLAFVVDAIGQKSTCGLLEIVNYNVRGHQYVVAGTRPLLAVLGVVLDQLGAMLDQLGAMLDQPGRSASWRASALAIIAQTVAPSLNDCRTLSRSRATIPLPGIDVPFHSTHLISGADQFRTCIHRMIRPTDTDMAIMQGRYIPNINAQRFHVTRAFATQVLEQTQSPVLAHELSLWPEDEQRAFEDHPEERMRLASVLVIELLSYQFASPVRWIETQDRLFNEMQVERVVEIGVVPILCRMAEASLKVAGMDGRVALMHVLRDEDDIYYRAPRLAQDQAQDQDQAINKLAKAAVLVEDVPLAVVKDVPLAVVKDVPLAVVKDVPLTIVKDVPLTAVDVICAVIAQKTKRPLADVPASSSLRDLTGGKSTLLNEIIGDLLKEFNILTTQPIPDRIDEISLSEVSSGLNLKQPLKGLGKYTAAQVARLFSAKMPGSVSISAARRGLADTHGLVKAHQQDAALLVALTMEPAVRLEDKDKAGEWLALVAQTYADAAGIDLLPATPSSGQSGRPALSPLLLAGGANINSVEFDHAQTKLRRMAEQQIQAYAEYLAAPSSANHQHQQLGLSMHTTHDALHKLQQKNIETTQRLDDISAELGPEFIDGIRGIFSAQKARRFDSYWNWARQDVVSWFNSVRVSKLPVDWTAESTQRRILMIANRADDALIALLDGLIHHLDVATQLSAGKSTEAAELLLLHKLHAQCIEALGSTEGSSAQPVYRELSRPSHPATEISVAGKLSYSECSPRPGEPTFAEYVSNVSAKHAEFPPLIHLRQRTQSYTWEYSEEQSAEYYNCLHEQCATAAGVSFANTTVLITGASQGSIGAQVLQGLLSGGSFVIATTTSYAKVMPFYEQLYRDYGAKGSVLIVVPFNQASTQDVSQLVEFIYSTLGRNLDYVLPFAALADYGSDISQLGPRCELSMRLMLTNVMRLLGEIKHAKEVRQWDEWPTLAVLPMSPNHGELGYDGLYGESKAALETVFSRWRSESWGSLISIAGAVIGWTRGTGLMSINNPAAEHVERQSHGGRTFSTAEMAFNILGLLHPRIIAMSHLSPIWADLNGGLQRIQNVAETMAGIRQYLAAECSRRNAIAMSYFADISVASGHDAGVLHKEYGVDPLFNHQQYFTQPPSMSPGHDQLRDLRQLEGMANLDKVIVVTGYGEVGPYGNAETRWEMEAYGEFSLEGCIELAWIMGLIKNAPKGHIGWVDAKTGETVADKDIKRKYEKFILEHTGIRTLEADHLWDVQDPAVIPLMRELQIQHDLPAFEASADEAQQFKLRNQDKVDICDNGDGSWSVRFLRGACLMVPKALRFDRLVGAQLPSGWSPERYGIPKDIIQQVDLVTCYAIIATVEALVRSGITDPYELYAYFHVSEVGTSMGSGAGGVHSIRDLYRRRLTDKPVQSDILQETFANSMAAWVNMLLLSSAGPIKTPIGGCASALLSIDVAADTIRQGKARVMMAGAFEGIVDQGSYEFAQMGATCSSTNEEAQGRLPREMSRPSTHSRSGFVETQGAGVVVLMSASAALEFGAPIYAIIAYTGTATDKQGYSLPAPGMGLLTSARQQQQQQPPSLPSLPLLSIEYRKRQLQAELKFIDSWASLKTQQEADNSEAVSAIAEQAETRRAAALDTWGIDFWHKNSKISPLRGSLAAWGLCANDIGLASLHGTATVANDLNESKVLDAQLRALGRSPGLAIPAVCQKWLTGHPKGPAAAWMLNGAIQSMRTGLVPGNRNADNIDKELCCEYIFYPSRSIQTPMVKAALLKSYGFGQVGAELLVVHPHYLLATLSEREIEEYRKKTTRREHRAYRYWQDTFAGNHPFFQPKSSPPFSPDMEKQVYLDSLLRAKYDAKTGSYHF